jgi:hypothetical protein
MLIGSSRQFDAEDNAVDQAILESHVATRGGISAKPGELSAIRVWTGPSRGDAGQIADHRSECGERQNLARDGHEGLGITTSLGTGRLLADLLLGRASEIPLRPYSPAICERSGAA